MAVHAKALAEVDPIEPLIQRGAHREAAGECARRHGGALGRLCMAMLGSQAEAEEALQDTLLAAHDAMGEWRGEGTVRAWLFGIARHVCARRLERRSTRERRLRLVGEGGGGGDVGAELPDAIVDARRRAASIREALAKLAPSERETLLLRYEAELSYREIGQACGIDEATARKRASRALARLRSVITGDGR
jgi:RNA polymerase sigma-70 factor (ECF subfamily)